MRRIALCLLLAAFVPLHAAAQGGLRVAPESALGARAEGDGPTLPLALTPLGGQGFTLMQPGWAGAGFRAPPGLDADAPSRFALARTGAGGASGLDIRLDRWTVSSSVRGLGAARTELSRVDVGASYGLPLAKRHELLVSGGLGFGAAAGLAPTAGQDFTAREAWLLPTSGGTGLREAGLRLSWRYSLDRNLYVNTSVGVDRMFSDPTGLGASYERNVGSVGAVFGYRFY
jgi:hypothetical protein